MGFQENGNGEMGLSAIPLGAKNKYKRMNSELPEDNDDVLLQQQQQEERRRSTRKYVLACAIFASLNNVLLGYGMIENHLFWSVLWKRFDFVAAFSFDYSVYCVGDGF